MSTAKIRETKLLFGVGLRRTKFAREFFPFLFKGGENGSLRVSIQHFAKGIPEADKYDQMVARV